MLAVPRVSWLHARDPHASCSFCVNLVMVLRGGVLEADFELRRQGLDSRARVMGLEAKLWVWRRSYGFGGGVMSSPGPVLSCSIEAPLWSHLRRF